MLNKINQQIIPLKIPGIRYFSNKISDIEDGVNLTIGQPDFNTPENVKRAGINAIERNKTGYSHNAGLFELRAEVSSFFKEKYNLSYNPESEIIITNGASEGIDSVLRTITCHGDEIILPAPIYPAYESVIKMNGGEIVYLDTTDTGFKPSPERLKSLITDKTKGVILNYPSNPTGVTLDLEEVEAIVKVIKEYNIFVISDEIYSENTFFGTHTSFASYPEIRGQLFLVHGLSKSHAMTGWRIGFVLGASTLMEQVLKVHLNNSICASLPSQIASIEALSKNRENLKEMNKSYINRCNLSMHRLHKMGMDFVRPNGAFYIFPSIKKYKINSWDFANKLLELQKVAVVPGSGFSKYGEGYIRISIASSEENLNKAFDRMELFINEI